VCSSDLADGRKFWATCESELRARSIEFEDAGTYMFPVTYRYGLPITKS